MNRYRFTHIALSLLVGGFLISCQLSQDVGYARWLGNNGNPQLAKKELRALSDAGYTDAKLALADLYSKSDNREEQLLAGAYYRDLETYSENASSQYVRWLARMSYTDESFREKAHKGLLKRQASHHDALPLLARFYAHHKTFYSSEEIRDLLDGLESAPDSNHSDTIKILNGLDNPENFTGYISRACADSSETDWSSGCYQLHFKLAKIKKDNTQINNLINQLEKSLLEATILLKSVSEETLYKCAVILLKEEFGERMILSGLKVANLGNVNNIGPRRFLLSAKYEYKRSILMSDEVLLAGLNRLVDHNNVDATRLLGRMYAKGYRVIDDPVKSEELLLKIVDDHRAALYLGRLYLSGKLGPQKLLSSIDLLLYAARNGSYKGYYDLAHAFNGFPGIKANPTYSSVFAKMAIATTEPPARAHEMNQLIATLTNTDNSEEQRLLQLENSHIQNKPSSQNALMRDRLTANEAQQTIFKK